MHVVSLTPHAQCMWVIENGCAVHAVCIVKFSNNFEKGKSSVKQLCYKKKIKNA
jgi:hypothetical protein